MKLLEKLRKVMKSLTGPVSPTTPRVVPEAVANTASVNAPVSSASVFAGHSPVASGRGGEIQKQGESGLIARLRREFEEYEPSRQSDAVPELTTGEIARALETKYPGLWHLCYPRVYKSLPGYPSIKNIAVDLASTLCRGTRRQGPDTYQEDILAVSGVGSEVNQAKSPTISRRC